MFDFAEEREEPGEGSDSHPVHELARPRRPRRTAPPPETEAAGQRFQERLQRPHRCSLQACRTSNGHLKYSHSFNLFPDFF